MQDERERSTFDSVEGKRREEKEDKTFFSSLLNWSEKEIEKKRSNFGGEESPRGGASSD